MKLINEKGQFIKTGSFKKCIYCGNNFYVKQCQLEIKKFCSKECHYASMKGKSFCEDNQFKKGFIPWHKNKLVPIFAKFGIKNPMWKGGIVDPYRKLKDCSEWKHWRKDVFERDNYTCCDCGHKGGTLHPHHLFERSKYPELIFEVSNGRTLCKDCHKNTLRKEKEYRDSLKKNGFNSVKILFQDNAEPAGEIA